MKLKCILLSVLLPFCSLTFANTDLCPTVKSYQPAQAANFKYRLSNDLEIKTIQPNQMLLGGGVIIYFDANLQKSMSYELVSEEWENPCRKEYKNFIEVKLDNVDYRAFLTNIKIGTLSGAEKDYINVYIVPNNPKKDFVHFLQFKGFTTNEVGSIISTINNGELK